MKNGDELTLGPENPILSEGSLKEHRRARRKPGSAVKSKTSEANKNIRIESRVGEIVLRMTSVTQCCRTLDEV